MFKKLLVAAVCSLAALPVSAGAAFAGEVNGTGADTPALDHARSICASSGLNHDHSGTETNRVQSYGQLVSSGLKAFIPSPGSACNGHTGWLAGS